jgi:hypothetical protein
VRVVEEAGRVRLRLADLEVSGSCGSGLNLDMNVFDMAGWKYVRVRQAATEKRSSLFIFRRSLDALLGGATS